MMERSTSLTTNSASDETTVKPEGVKSRQLVVDWSEFAAGRRLPLASSKDCFILQSDTRKILPEFHDQSIPCVITSPPYGKLKDYGSAEQLGFGQDVHSEYLPDLRQVFTDLFRIVMKGGAMWVVLDMMRHSGETVVLPWEVITLAKGAGWSFHDLVIWDKGKSLPWPNHGRFRGVCEYILLFGKGKLRTFNLDASRDSKNLSPYWVKYPERYHPDGKAPSDLWHFPIPNQGTWSGSKIKHQCPFPVGLVERMISISTRKGDTVLDPFSGSGIVPTIAAHMGRVGVGIEVNERIITDLRASGIGTLQKWIAKELSVHSSGGKGLRNHIIRLRINKYPKTLFAGMVRADEVGASVKDDIGAFIVETVTEGTRSSKFAKMKLSILLRKGSNIRKLKDAATKLSTSEPLTLFGIEAKIELIPENKWNKAKFVSDLKQRPWYLYRKGKFFSFDERIPSSKLLGSLQTEANAHTSVPSIFSNLALTIEPPPKDSVSV